MFNIFNNKKFKMFTAIAKLFTAVEHIVYCVASLYRRAVQIYKEVRYV